MVIFRDRLLRKVVFKIFKRFNILSIQKDKASVSVFLRAFKRYNLDLKQSLKTKKHKNRNFHRASYYSYVILSGSKLKAVLDMITQDHMLGKGNF